jgi:DNA invertase Pin-like site-specific DNA recombinase
MKHRKPQAQDASRKAVAYVRVSTEEQAREGVSLDMQESRLRAYCTMSGLELVALVREEGVSGSTPLASRPGGGELVRVVNAHGAAHVVALKLDRLFRDAADALNTTRAWDDEGVALHLVDMGGQTINTASAMGRLFLTMTAAFAELERNLIAERTRSALHHKRDKGEAVSRAARGLRIEAGRFAPDPDSDGLRLVARARVLRGQGLTLNAVAGQLAAEGFRPERGRRFYPSVLRYMLRNPRLEACA